jgi:hypothetical protein
VISVFNHSVLESSGSTVMQEIVNLPKPLVFNFVRNSSMMYSMDGADGADPTE